MKTLISVLVVGMVLTFGAFVNNANGWNDPPPSCPPCGCNGCVNYCTTCESYGCEFINPCGKCQNCSFSLGCYNLYAAGCETCNESDGSITNICGENEYCCSWGEPDAQSHACYDHICQACTATGPVDIAITNISAGRVHTPKNFYCLIETSPPGYGCGATWTWTGNAVGGPYCSPLYDPYCCPGSLYVIDFLSCGPHTITATICSSSQSIEVYVPYCKVYTWPELEKCDRVDDPSMEPSANGCTNVPDYPLCASAVGIGIDYTPDCNQHDLCYDTCGNDKGTCDTQLKAGLENSCYPLLSVDPDCYSTCVTQADLYYVGVMIGAWPAYWNAQLAQCACCNCE